MLILTNSGPALAKVVQVCAAVALQSGLTERAAISNANANKAKTRRVAPL
jgi:hypothetical protein